MDINIDQLPAFAGIMPDTTLFIIQVNGSTFKASGDQLAQAFGGGGGSGSLSAGIGIDIDTTDPAITTISSLLSAGSNITITPQGDNSIQISSTGGGGGSSYQYNTNIFPAGPVDITAEQLASSPQLIVTTSNTVNIPVDALDGSIITIVSLVSVTIDAGTGVIYNALNNTPGNTFILNQGMITLVKGTFSGITYWFITSYTFNP